jgi:excinuclease UvrABC helicase subunit UvrB
MGKLTGMQDLAPIAFVAGDGDVRINFGVFSGREATPAEIDELARTLLSQLDAVTIVAEQRYIVDRESEASVHQIRIELDGADPQVPLALAERWAEACVADRHAEISEG